MPSSFTKDPDAVLDYQCDWSAWLTEISDAIQTSTWIVPDGITKDDEANDTSTATVWLSGGTVGTQYSVVNRIVTAGGRTDDRTLVITVQER